MQILVAGLVFSSSYVESQNHIVLTLWREPLKRNGKASGDKGIVLPLEIAKYILHICT